MNDQENPTTEIKTPHAGHEPKLKRPARRNAVLGAGALGILALGFAAPQPGAAGTIAT